VLLLWPYSLDVFPIAWANLVGVGVQVLVLYWILRRYAQDFGMAFGFQSPMWRLFKNAIGWLLVGQIIISFNQPIDVYLASLTGVGGVSELGYAKKILALLLGLGATAVGRAILPVLSDQGTVAAVIGWYLSPLAVAVLFERGEFNASNTEAVAQVLQWGLFQLPFFFAGIVLVQLTVSLGHYRYIFYTGCLGILIKIVSGYILVDRMGIPGLMLSTALMYAGNWLLLLLLSRGRFSLGPAH